MMSVSTVGRPIESIPMGSHWRLYATNVLLLDWLQVVPDYELSDMASLPDAVAACGTEMDAGEDAGVGVLLRRL